MGNLTLMFATESRFPAPPGMTQLRKNWNLPRVFHAFYKHVFCFGITSTFTLFAVLS